jgi:hypothetical protein
MGAARTHVTVCDEAPVLRKSRNSGDTILISVRFSVGEAGACNGGRSRFCPFLRRSSGRPPESPGPQGERRNGINIVSGVPDNCLLD